MSEARDSERAQARGEFAEAFLRAVHYPDYEIALLGDLSLVSPAHVKALLTAKLEEIKTFEEVARDRPDFKTFKGKPSD
ncbi:MAG: hypothetical protein ABSF82_00520 [Candidatus Bathyarchaeia archaeon]